MQIWHLSSGRGVFGKPIRSYVQPSLTDDESRAAIVLASGSIDLIELESGREVDRLMTGSLPRAIAFDPLGRRLAVASANPPQLEVWDLTTKTSGTKLTGMMANIHSVDWDREGRRLAIGLATPANCAEVWEVATQRKLATFVGHSQDVTMAAFHPAGELLITRSWDGFCRVWDANSAKSFLAWPGGMSGSFSTDGHILGHVHARGRNRLVELVAEQEYQTLVSGLGAGNGDYRNGSISSDGRMFALGMDDGVRIWDLDRNLEVAVLNTGQTPSPIFTPDGKELLTNGESGLQRWTLTYNSTPDNPKLEVALKSSVQGKATRELTSATKRNAVDEIRIGPPRSITLPVDSSYISQADQVLGVCSPRAGQGLIVNLATDTVRATLGSHSRLDRIVVSPDGRWAATYGWHSPTVKIWDARTAILAKELRAELPTVNFSPDSKQLILCESSQYSFLEIDTWRNTKTLAREHCPYPGVIAFSTDGQLMAVELSSAIISLMDVESGESLAKLEDPYRDRPTWMNFTPDGSRLVAVSNYSKNVHVWDLSSIRKKLRALGLDWDSGSLAEREQVQPAQPPRVTVDLGDFEPRSNANRQ